MVLVAMTGGLLDPDVGGCPGDRESRAVRRWSRADLADHLDVSRQTVNAIETGRYDPSLPLAFKIAEVFDDQIEALFFPEPNANGQSRL